MTWGQTLAAALVAGLIAGGVIVVADRLMPPGEPPCPCTEGAAPDARAEAA